MRVFLSLLGKKNWELLTQLNKINSKSNGKIIAPETEECLSKFITQVIAITYHLEVLSKCTLRNCLRKIKSDFDLPLCTLIYHP